MPDRHIRRSGDDYGTALLSLLPTGQAWPRDEASVLVRAMRGVADVLGYVDGRAADLLERESDPTQTVELLSDWERNWGLPDECFGDNESIDQRRRILMMVMTMLGGQSRQFFIDMAAWLGYIIRIDEYSPFTCGLSQVGDTRDIVGYSPNVIVPFPFTPLRYFPNIELNFVVGQGYSPTGPNLGGFGPIDSFVTVARSSIGYVQDSAGKWTLVAANTLRWSDKGALIEEQRTNLVLNSLSNPYSADPLTTEIPPLFPAASVRKCTWDTAPTGDNNVYAFGVSGWALSTAYAVSVWVYIPTNPNITGVRWSQEGGTPWVVVFKNADLTKRDQWQQLTYQATSGTTGASQLTPVLRLTSAVPTDFIYVTAPQVEAGAFPTSFIGTSGTAGTRPADVVRVLGQAFGPKASMFAIGTSYGVGTYQGILEIDDNTINNRAVLYRFNGSASSVTTSGGTLGNTIVGPIWAINTRGKTAYGLATGRQQFVFNGAVIGTGTATWPPVGLLSQIAIGGVGAGVPWNGYIERIAIWTNHQLSTAEMQVLTGADDRAALTNDPGIVVASESNLPIYSSYRWEIGAPEMRFYWTAHVTAASLQWFRAGSAELGIDPFLRIGIPTDLDCLLRRWKPAHTELIFDFTNMTNDGYADWPP